MFYERRCQEKYFALGQREWRSPSCSRMQGRITKTRKDKKKKFSVEQSYNSQPFRLRKKGGVLRSTGCAYIRINYHMLHFKEVVGANGFEPSTSWSRTSGSKISKCFIWCRFGTRTRFSS